MTSRKYGNPDASWGSGGNSKPALDFVPGWQPGAKERLAAGLESDRLESQKFESEAHTERIKLEVAIETCRQAGDVEGMLALVAEGIVRWALGLKNFFFMIFDESEDGAYTRKLTCSNPIVKPLYLLQPFAGATDTYDLIEFAISTARADAFGKKIALLDQKRQSFCDEVTKLGQRWDIERDFEAWDRLDRHRSWLKREAVETARYIESVIRLIQAGRLGPTLATIQPKAADMPASKESDRPSGVHPPRTVVYRSKEHDCELTKQEMNALSVMLPNVETDFATLMNRKSGVWKEQYVASTSKRNKISRLLTRLNDKLLNASPPLRLRFSIRKGTDFITREEYVAPDAQQ